MVGLGASQRGMRDKGHVWNVNSFCWSAFSLVGLLQQQWIEKKVLAMWIRVLIWCGVVTACSGNPVGNS